VNSQPRKPEHEEVEKKVTKKVEEEEVKIEEVTPPPK